MHPSHLLTYLEWKWPLFRCPSIPCIPGKRLRVARVSRVPSAAHPKSSAGRAPSLLVIWVHPSPSAQSWPCWALSGSCTGQGGVVGPRPLVSFSAVRVWFGSASRKFPLMEPCAAIYSRQHSPGTQHGASSQQSSCHPPGSGCGPSSLLWAAARQRCPVWGNSTFWLLSSPLLCTCLWSRSDPQQWSS